MKFYNKQYKCKKNIKSIHLPFQTTLKIFFIGVFVIFAVQQSESVIHIYFHSFLDSSSIQAYYRLLSRVPWAIQQVLISYLLYIYQCQNTFLKSFNRKLQIFLVYRRDKCQDSRKSLLCLDTGSSGSIHLPTHTSAKVTVRFLSVSFFYREYFSLDNSTVSCQG